MVLKGHMALAKSPLLASLLVVCLPVRCRPSTTWYRAFRTPATFAVNSFLSIAIRLLAQPTSALLCRSPAWGFCFWKRGAS